MTDLMEERLSTHARRWQAEQAPPPGVPLDRLDERLDAGRPRAVRWRSLVAAAAVVVVIGAVAMALTARSHDEPASPADTTGTPTTPATPHHNLLAVDVPWRNLPAGHPDVRHRKHGQLVTPFDRVSATGTISGHLHPGDTLTFTAVLQSPTRLVLDPCPDFNIAFGKHFWRTWQLNCRQVPFRDGHGRPFLPAFRDARFAMKVRVPDVRGDQKVLWTLDGPQRMPGFYGIVTVVPD